MLNHSDQTNASPDYLSYLMRLCRTQDSGSLVWRVSLQEPLTHEVFRFEDLQSLFAFLQAKVGQQEPGVLMSGE